MNELYSFLESISSKSDFNAELSRKGGYITFSNSGRRGGAKYFQIGLENILQTLRDILSHLDVFRDITEYEEKAWRDNGSEFFTDPVANANSTVQTKPLFSTLSKVIIWANQPVLDYTDPDRTIALTTDFIQTAIERLETVSESFTPVNTPRMKTINDSLQQIFYGSPGTGKSHVVKINTEGESVVRTTFHPDSDYSTFVGCYKPTSKKVEMRDAEGKVIMAEDRIIYKFVDQSFLQAYIKAWKFYAEKKEGAEPKKQYLIIEEINRGNCAQIFGDLFQLLDRNDYGFSDYYIHTDKDMQQHIAEIFSLENVVIEGDVKDAVNAMYHTDEGDVVSKIMSGEILLLPSNLYIWATMNTSDQSLFPIDSAFKRRWDWVYTPIKQHDEGYKIVLGDDAGYDWWGFLEKINQVIDDATSSEDKKLGYFFVKAQDKEIRADKFVGKVLFYLWNDVFKNYGFDSPIFSKGGNKKFAFSDFFTKEGEPDTEMVKSFLDRLDETIDKDNSFKIKNDKSDSSAEAGEQA